MTVKRLLNKLSKAQQDYYTFLAKECFSGFSNAEDNFNIYRYASSYAWLFHSSEFFWKALTVLSGKYFDLSHEASQADMAKISNDLLSDDYKIRAYDILSKFQNNRRDLARYGYYEKGTVTRSPIEIFNRKDTETSLNEIGWLVDRLREIHYYQIFAAPVHIGVLSGYIAARNEKPCSYYPHSEYRKKPAQWILDLNNIMYDDNESKLFQPSLTSISNLNSGTFSIVINPFGEAYPELGNTEGIGFKTILSYIRDGGIFVNSGGQPFVYSWDVNTGSHQLLVSFIPALSNIESSYIEGIPKLSINTNLGIPHEALLLKRYFNVETAWDHPEKNIVGPKEVDIQFDQLLGDDTKPITKANVYRPAKELSDKTIPLAHCSDKSIWGNVYPVVAVKFGRGFLIDAGMSLDEEREYKVLLDIIRGLCIIGYQTLASPSPLASICGSNGIT
jgi:hypothetical protein